MFLYNVPSKGRALAQTKALRVVNKAAVVSLLPSIKEYRLARQMVSLGVGFTVLIYYALPGPLD